MTRAIGAAFLAAFLASLALLSSSCFDQVAGNGSEVENAVVLGRVLLPGGEDAEGVRLQLLPEGFDPHRDAAPVGSQVAVTGKDGGFRLSAKAGSYNIYASHPRLGYKLLISGMQLKPRTEHHAGQRSLREPGAIRLALPTRARPGDYVYLPGTPMARAVDSAHISAGYVLVDSVPSGRIGKVVLASASPSVDSVSGLGSDVAVSARGVTELAYTEWKHEGVIAIRIRDAAGGLAERVAGIPLLLRLDAGNFDFKESNRSGGDLRITRDDGKPLAWHIQSWDSAGSQARVWVRMDTVFAESTEQKFRLYWGAPDTAKAAAPGGSTVFPVGDGYLGAWHLDSRPKGTPAHFPDAGGRSTRALALGALATADSVAAGDTGVGVHPAHGVLGSGLHLNGTDAYLAVDDTAPTPPGFTLTFWFRTTTKEGGKIAGFVMPGVDGSVKGKTGNFNFDRVMWMDDDGLLHFGFTMATKDSPSVLGTWQPFVSAAAFNDGKWHHVGCSLSGSGFNLYVDGVQVVGYTGPVRPLSKPGFWRLGWVGEGMWDPAWTSEYFRGSLDEVRILNEARSGEWLRLDQVSQDPGAGLMELQRH